MKHGGKRAGAGRPRKLKQPERITVAVDARTLKQLDKYAKRHDINRSASIRIAIEKLLSEV